MHCARSAGMHALRLAVFTPFTCMPPVAATPTHLPQASAGPGMSRRPLALPLLAEVLGRHVCAGDFAAKTHEQEQKQKTVIHEQSEKRGSGWPP